MAMAVGYPILQVTGQMLAAMSLREITGLSLWSTCFGRDDLAKTPGRDNNAMSL
jgi:hypothetical protein